MDGPAAGLGDIGGDPGAASSSGSPASRRRAWCGRCVRCGVGGVQAGRRASGEAGGHVVGAGVDAVGGTSPALFPWWAGTICMRIFFGGEAFFKGFGNQAPGAGAVAGEKGCDEVTRIESTTGAGCVEGRRWRCWKGPWGKLLFLWTASESVSPGEPVTGTGRSEPERSKPQGVFRPGPSVAEEKR